MRSLRLRLLFMLVAVLVVALGTVALVARGATTFEFERYVERRQYGLRVAAEQLAEAQGGRIVLASDIGEVVVDTGGELIGRKVDPPVIRRLVGRSVSETEIAIASEWTARGVPPPDVRFFEFIPPPREGDVVIARMAAPPGTAASPGEEVFLSSVNRSLLFAVVAGGLAAVGLALFFSRRMLGPVFALTEAARRMERGDLSTRVRVGSRDEIGELARAFNAMADSLARTEQLRRTMVSDIAHELRTPLSNVRGYLEALSDGVARPTPAVIGSLHEEALLLSRLVDDLQELTLAEAGQLQLQRQSPPVADLVALALQAAEPAAGAKGLTLRTELAADLPMADADAVRIGQVLRNLLANAIAYTESGGEVVVAAARVDNGIELRVRDTGVGIAPEHLPHVFERFYRVDRSRDRATGGTGIGLSIVRELVYAHGGRIAIESTPGQGTTVAFTLPVASVPAPDAHPVGMAPRLAPTASN